MSVTELLSLDEVEEIREKAALADLHEESLLNVPLIRNVFTNRNFRLTERGIDAYWTYQKVIPVTVTGFNPHQSSYFYARNSLFARWLRQPFASARELNEGDFLVTEALFMVHDFLHAWTYQMIEKLRPESGAISGKITSENFDRHTFYHLLSEAVATAGLDYWFLAVKDLNAYCNIGSVKGPLTVSYLEAHLPEYQKFCPSFQVQTPELLPKLTSFYCTGKFPGFDASDLRRSPRLLAWLRHELRYGVTQRELTRSWLSFLAEEPIACSSQELSSPLSVTAEFRQLAEDLAMPLWQLIKHGEDAVPVWIEPAIRRHSKMDRAPDFRFLNLNRWEPAEWRHLVFESASPNFPFLLFQYLASFPYAAMPRERLKYVELLKRECDPNLAQLLLRDLPRLPVGPNEPRDLFFAN